MGCGRIAATRLQDNLLVNDGPLNDDAPPSRPLMSGARAGAALAEAPAEAPPKVYLSLIIPAYNEQARLPATLDRLREYLAAQTYSYEVIVVDDGSRDGTRAVIERHATKWEQLRCLPNDRNRGKGYSVKHGVLESRGTDILFSDADLSTPIEESERLLRLIANGECDVAIGSRALPDSDLEVRQPFWREMMGRTFNKIVQRLSVPGISDTQCGFKAFRGDVARKLFALQHIEGFAFDVEVLYLARKFGYRIVEVPIRWVNSPDSRVSGLKHSWHMLAEVLSIRKNERRGLYHTQRD